MHNATPGALSVLVLELLPAAAFAFQGNRIAQAINRWPTPIKITLPALCAIPLVLKWIYIFIFVAVPEELFFRVWLQNLLERRAGRKSALAIASVLFGLSHFNKRSTTFNWRYVILATIAGIFYGRAWREQRRLPASSITHATVDAIWTFWF